VADIDKACEYLPLHLEGVENEKDEDEDIIADIVKMTMIAWTIMFSNFLASFL
jgi:hypothetical protein